MAAPTESRTPNLHRAKIAQHKSADGRVATEAAWLRAKDPLRKSKTVLTRTGLLMEGVGLMLFRILADRQPDRATR